MSEDKKVLVIGSGGREHALALKLAQSPEVSQVIIAPGNPGMVHLSNAGKLLLSSDSPLDIARKEGISLAVIGPEVPLCEGLGDALREAGFPVFGPGALGAKLEGSKAFMKDVLRGAGIATAAYHVVKDAAELDTALKSFTEPPVVKADGLCAGKGVVVADSFEEARAATLEMLSGDAFGDAGKVVVLEERLGGAEASVHVVTDGTNYQILPVVQDHKRIGEGDTGPNTGGMGTYGPAPLVDAELLKQIDEEMVKPLLAQLRKEGIPFVGTLFLGLMITEARVPWMLEINTRFGDPETQILMALLDSDLFTALDSAARGKFIPGSFSFGSDCALCVVLAAEGYPGTPKKGASIQGCEEAAQLAQLSMAGTAIQDAQLTVNGGRVIGVTGRGKDLFAAREAAYAAVGKIHFDGMQFRRDIGHRALKS